MQKNKYILILLLLVGLVACYYHPDLPADGTSENKTDSVPETLHKRAYALSSNLKLRLILVASSVAVYGYYSRCEREPACGGGV